MFNSTILIRGVQKPLFVSYAAALETQKIFNDKSIPSEQPISVAGKSFRKSDIKYIEIEKDGNRAVMWDELTIQFYQDEKVNHANLSKQSPEAKARMLDMFSVFYKTATKNDPTPEILEQAYQAQLQFFKDNPTRTLCDVSVLKSLILKLDHSHSGNWSELNERLRESFFRLVERAVVRDMQLSA
jgi:hypothetical protein